MSVSFGANFKVHVKIKVDESGDICNSFSFEFYIESIVEGVYDRILDEADKVAASMVGERSFTIGDISITNVSNGE